MYCAAQENQLSSGKNILIRFIKDLICFHRFVWGKLCSVYAILPTVNFSEHSCYLSMNTHMYDPVCFGASSFSENKFPLLIAFIFNKILI
jgi:hypothetical protein